MTVCKSISSLRYVEIYSTLLLPPKLVSSCAPVQQGSLRITRLKAPLGLLGGRGDRGRIWEDEVWGTQQLMFPLYVLIKSSDYNRMLQISSLQGSNSVTVLGLDTYVAYSECKTWLNLYFL